MGNSSAPAGSILDSALQAVLEAAIRAGQPGGSTASYFTAEGGWQAPLRHRCNALLPLMASGSPTARDLGIVLLQEVNGRYRTRHPQSAFHDLLRGRT